MPELLRTAGFRVVELPSKSYVMMASEMATLPKGFAGKIPVAQQVIMLTYGAKSGGIVRMYQTPAVNGVDPTELMKTIARLGIFRDVNRRPGWVFKVRKVGSVLVIPGSSSEKHVDEALRNISQGD